MTTTDPQWWIDYMEGETDLRLQADLKELLALSETDRTELETLQKLRALIRQSEPHLILSDRQAGRLHDKIMNAVKGAPKIQNRDVSGGADSAQNQSAHPPNPSPGPSSRFTK